MLVPFLSFTLLNRVSRLLGLPLPSLDLELDALLCIRDV